MSWTTVRIGDHCEITSSKRIFLSDYVDAGIPFWRSKEVIEQENGQSISDPLFITHDKYEEIKNRFGVPKPGDMLLTSVGTIGIPFIVKSTSPFYFKDGNLTWFRNFAVTLSSRYLYYWIKSNNGHQTLNNLTIGSSQKALTIENLKNAKIPLPDLPTQRRIASILSAYDDLIENNRRQIKLLEEAAQRLYREWFVELRFPGHESVKVVDGVPEGWKKVCLKDICETKTGKKDANFGCDDGAYPFFTCAQAPIKAPSYSFDCSAVILAGNGDFNVKLYRGKFEAYQRTYVLSPANTEYLFLLYNAVSRNMNVLTKGASGSTIKFLTKGMIDSIELLIPSSQLLTTYNQNSEALQKSIEALHRKVALAVEARDRLLPKLINHEMEVML